MTEHRAISDLPPAAFRENIPRFDQRLRVTARMLLELWSDGFDNLHDLMSPSDDRLATEDRLAYAHRKAEHRRDTVGLKVDSYILEKGFGTETARDQIRRRQALHPELYT